MRIMPEREPADFKLQLNSMLPRWEFQPILNEEEVRLEPHAGRGRASGSADTPPPYRPLFANL
jgi:hypothetical protein